MEEDVSLDEPMFLAAVDMVRRTGTLEFQIRYQDDNEPTVWIALARHKWGTAGRPVASDKKGIERWTTASSMSPVGAVVALCETLIDGGMCAHCHRPAGITVEIDPMPAGSLICWTQYDPELKTFRRACEGET